MFRIARRFVLSANELFTQSRQDAKPSVSLFSLRLFASLRLCVENRLQNAVNDYQHGLSGDGPGVFAS